MVSIKFIIETFIHIMALNCLAIIFLYNLHKKDTDEIHKLFIKTLHYYMQNTTTSDVNVVCNSYDCR